MPLDYLKLSQEVSYALRHAPWEYELELDALGFVPMGQLLTALNECGNYSCLITKDDLQKMIEVSDKKRHEIVGDRIRALYGHSISMKIRKQEACPPNILYHGTTHFALADILDCGLKPMNRQYVHLSVDIETARQVGTRRDKEPVILLVDAQRAYKNNIKFYIGNDKVWLVDELPSEFFTLLE